MYKMYKTKCRKTLFDILKYSMVYVDVCFSMMATAFLQVQAEFHNKALKYNCRAQNAALSWPQPGWCLFLYEYPETWL